MVFLVTRITRGNPWYCKHETQKGLLFCIVFAMSAFYITNELRHSHHYQVRGKSFQTCPLFWPAPVCSLKQLRKAPGSSYVSYAMLRQTNT